MLLFVFHKECWWNSSVFGLPVSSTVILSAHFCALHNLVIKCPFVFNFIVISDTM